MSQNTSIKQLVPVVKLTEPVTYGPWKWVDCPYIVVRLADLLLQDGQSFNSKYDEIKLAGGFHNFLGYNGKILLSTIMPDKMIFGFTPKMYIECIKILKPDFYMTPDGETYEGEHFIAKNEIIRVIEETIHIMNECKDSIPFGLIKGSNFVQQKFHLRCMQQLGIEYFIFHTGDFLRSGRLQQRDKALQYVKKIKPMVKYLGLYGIGSKDNFRKFFLADCFITQSHYTKAFLGLTMQNGKWMKFREKEISSIVMSNLVNLNDSIELLKNEYGGLRKWVAAREVTVYHMRHRDKI